MSCFLDFCELLSWILDNHAQPKLFAMTVWTVWNQRNQIRHYVPSCKTDQIAQVALEKLNEFRYILPQPMPARPQPKAVWKPTPSGIFKLNFDGAVFKFENKSGVGVAIRDCRGQIIASLAQVLPQAYDAMEIEALAAHRALVFGLEVGISEAVLEGDCQTVMQALKEGGSNFASVKPLILDALSQSSSFTKSLYSHTKRDGNKLAYSLARLSINVDNYIV